MIWYCQTHDEYFDTDWHTECPWSDEDDVFCSKCCECVSSDDGSGHQSYCEWVGKRLDIETGEPWKEYGGEKDRLPKIPPPS